MSKDKSLSVICPICDAWKGKPCVHTKGSKKGKKRSEPHDDRIRLAKVQRSAELEDIGKDKAPTSIQKMIKKNPLEKLSPEEKEVVRIILDKIEALNRNAEFVGPVTRGPILTTYRFFPVRKTKVAHLEGLAKDFAVALGVNENVLVKRMPGESTVGIFVPNKKRTIIEFEATLPYVREFMSVATDDGHLPIPLNFGVDSSGVPSVDDLTQLPHLLVAGTTGGGKSTWARSALQSMAWFLTPEQLKLVIIDTKAVDFKQFRHFPHLLRDEYSKDLMPPATNVPDALKMLQLMVSETQRRLDLFAMEEVHNIHEYNKRQAEAKKMPYIVVYIDEMFDILGKPEKSLAKAISKLIEEIVGRARASGIYMIGSTQRPSAGLVKGQIKANFSARLSFRLPSSVDSKVVLTTKGAENLMSKGDMLYLSSINPELKRLHAPFSPLEKTKEIVTAIMQREEQAKEERRKKYELEKSKESKQPVAIQ